MAQKGINKVILVGRLGKSPEVKYLADGDQIVNLSLATSESWKDANGVPQERTEWHRIVMFKGLAKIAAQYLDKGSQVYIEGKLQTRKWQDDGGQDRYTTEIVANNMQMLGGRQDNGAQGTGYQSQPAQQPAAAQQPQKQSGYNQSNSYANASGGSNARTPPPQQSGPVPEPNLDFDDDIPF